MEEWMLGFVCILLVLTGVEIGCVVESLSNSRKKKGSIWCINCKHSRAMGRECHACMNLRRKAQRINKTHHCKWYEEK